MRQGGEKLGKFLGRWNGETETGERNRVTEPFTARYRWSPGWKALVPGRGQNWENKDRTPGCPLP